MGRKIVIYGGTGGVGFATGKLLRAQGDTLHLVGRDLGKLENAARELDASFTVGNVNETELFARVAKDAGEVIDGLVYAVGTINLRGLQRLGEGDFLNDFRVNAMGAAMAVQASVGALKKSAGVASVVLYSSVAALQGFINHASMGMAKGAINGLTLSLAAEFAPKIRVNAIAPSLMQTPLAQGLLGSEQIAASLAGLMM